MTDSEFPEPTFIANGAWPSFSPDGKEVVFTGGNQNDGYYLQKIDRTGGTTTTISPLDFYSASRPDWSWNQETIALTGQEEEGPTSSLYLVNPDGSKFIQVAGLDDYTLVYPSWYKDCEHVVMMGYGPLAGSHDHQALFKINVNTSKIELLFYEDNFCAGRPSISPDGPQVVFAGTEGSYNQQNNQIWLNPPLQRLGSGTPSEDQGRSPNWSPDGKWIVFETDRFSQSGNYTLAVMPASTPVDGDATPIQILSTEYKAHHPEWSRDQEYIVFGDSTQGVGFIKTPKQFR